MNRPVARTLAFSLAALLVPGFVAGVSSGAQAAGPTSCIANTHELIGQAASNGWQTKELTGTVKTEAIRNINATPPVTHLHPGHLFISAMPETDDHPALGMLIFADKNCVTSIGSPMLLSQLETSIAGQPADDDSAR